MSIKKLSVWFKSDNSHFLSTGFKIYFLFFDYFSTLNTSTFTTNDSSTKGLQI